MEIKKVTPEDLPYWAQELIKTKNLPVGTFLYCSADLKNGDIIQSRDHILDSLKDQKVKVLGYRIANEQIQLIISH